MTDIYVRLSFTHHYPIHETKRKAKENLSYTWNEMLLLTTYIIRKLQRHCLHSITLNLFVHTYPPIVPPIRTTYRRIGVI